MLDGYEARSLGGPTLVRRIAAPASPRAAVLHVHGYNDYFFQTHLADTFARAGLAFYAVDMSRAGRSLQPDDIPHYMSNVREPGDDISLAADAVARELPGVPLVVHAHSTGALTAAVWAADRPAPALAGIVLDGPLCGRREHGIKRWGRVILPVLGRVAPRWVVSTKPSVYARNLHVSGGGRWEFDTELKRPVGVPARAAWAFAVQNAQLRIARGKLSIGVPVLVARSAQSGPESDDNPLLDTQDIVVDVEATARLTPLFGPHVTALVIEGGIHELSLSRPAAREEYLAAVTAWLDTVLP